MTIKVELTKERETKGTIRFASKEDDAPVNTLYVRKAEAKDLGDNITIEVKKA